MESLNVNEIIIALYKGKKIRKNTWDEDEYIHIKDGKIIDEKDEVYFFSYHDFQTDNSWVNYRMNCPFCGGEVTQEKEGIIKCTKCLAIVIMKEDIWNNRCN